MLQGQSTIVNEIHPIIDNIMFVLYPMVEHYVSPFLQEKKKYKIL
jgi:hypothetical protein